MATPEHAQWFARGRAHQREGRAVDAMLCYRRAVRADPSLAEIDICLAEVLWQLGRLPEAIAAWREAERVDPRSVASAQGLAEALLVTGDASGACAAAERALALTPDNNRAAMIRGVALLMTGDSGDGPTLATTVARALEREPQLAGIATLAGPLARVLDRAPDAEECDALLARIVQMPAALASVPPLLLALALEHGARATCADAADFRKTLVGEARARSYAPADIDALRRMAVAAARLDSTAARELGERYAALCVTEWFARVPIVWPRRTAGDRLRIVVLHAAAAVPDAIGPAWEAILALPRDAFAVTLATVGAPAIVAPEGVATVVLPQETTVASAKLIAAGDPDVLVDLAGLAAATGPLLAQRPARAIWSLGALALPIGEPLADRVVGEADALAAALRAAHGTRDPRGDCPLDPVAMSATWDDAVRAHQRGDRVAALAQYVRVLELQPEFAPAHYLSGIARREGGDLEGARAAFAAALAAAPAFVDVRLAAIRAAITAQKHDAAIALCEEGLALAPDDVALWRMLGFARLARDDGGAAVAAFERALVLDPTDGDVHFNHGNALRTLRDFAGSARAYQRALVFSPGLTAAEFNLGALFQEQGATDAAVTAYENVLKSDADNVAAYMNLGEVLRGAGRIDAWLANFHRFEARCPKALPLAVQALMACQYMADFPKLERYLDGLRDGRFEASGEIELVDCLEELLFLLLNFDVPPSTLHRLARTYDTAARHVYGEPRPRPAVRRPGRLRIGYLSADLRNHVMGKMIWSAVAHHDETRFDLFFYTLSKDSDDWTEKFRGLADRFDTVGHLSERGAAARIAADDLDILVDLSTHTKGAKPGILAMKPARVQITHVASAGTLGLSAVDFKLTDHYADVPENQAFQIESLLPMGGCVYPYRHIVTATEHPFHRAPLGIAADTVVIGAFASLLKLSRRCLALWHDVLARLPRAKVAFSPIDPALRGQYLRLAVAAGIAPDRLLFVPQGRTDAENQARYTLVDFVLDPMPYGGVNGTLEALDMGVPVVTLLGQRHGERTSYSILANLGVTETVAASTREYVDIAVRLAEDPAFMHDVRARIRTGLAHSPLTDMPAHTRNLERAYLTALERKHPAALAFDRDG